MMSLSTARSNAFRSFSNLSAHQIAGHRYHLLHSLTSIDYLTTLANPMMFKFQHVLKTTSSINSSDTETIPRAQCRSLWPLARLIGSIRRGFPSHACASTPAEPAELANSTEATTPQALRKESQTNQSPHIPPAQCDASLLNISFENPESSVLGTTKHEEELLQKALKHSKDPAQAEWEQVWYYGSAGAFSKVANHFHSVHFPGPATADGLTLSEPSLEVSNLKQEHQAIFEREETTKPSTFVPINEDDRFRRESRARSARNDQERFALLLGLPTYNEYVSGQVTQRREASEGGSSQISKRQVKKQARIARNKQRRTAATTETTVDSTQQDEGFHITQIKTDNIVETLTVVDKKTEGHVWEAVMSSDHSKSDSAEKRSTSPAEHRPLVVGLTKPRTTRGNQVMASSQQTAALEKELEKNVSSNVDAAAPSEDNSTAPSSVQPNQKKEKKEKGPKQPKQPKGGAAPPAPTTPALIDLRVGHILRAITHPNADSLYVSTIAMGDPEGTEHTQIDEETGKVVRTVCSGLNGLVPLEEMQNRKIIVVANLKPVNMRSIKSAAMVLAASPKQEEGADPHAPDRIVELVTPPEGAEAGDKAYFEGFEYGEGKGPEKQLNPKKKQWEAIQPGFYTSDDLVVGFDASKCEEVEGETKGNLVVDGKGKCTVKTLKGAVVR